MVARTLLLVVFGFSAFVTAEENKLESVARANTMFKTYCVSCHNEVLRTADLLLDKVNVEHLDQHAAVLERVLPRLRSRAMPPQGLPRPSQEDYEFLISHLESGLDQIAAVSPNPGRPVPHRLNRAEYSNAVRDILGVEFNVEQLLPTDPASRYGFDNIGDVLTLSPVMMETYLSAAKTISRLAIGKSDGRAVTEIYLVPDNFEQRQRVSDDVPIGTSGGAVIKHYFPVDGEYIVRAQLRQILSGLYAGKTIALAEPKEMEIRLDGQKLQQFTVDGVNNLDEELSVRMPVKAGLRTVAITFLRDNFKDEEIVRRNADTAFGGGIGMIEVEGPYNTSGISITPSRQKIFTCRPDSGKEEEKCANQIISSLARAAYRRPVTEDDVKPLLELYKSGRKDADFDAGVGLAIQGILISPGFLFRVEHDPANVSPGIAYPVSDLELASRLSFFIWSSVPDDTLLNIAIQGKLREPTVLKQQVRRMLEDPRSISLVKNFAAQWLHIRNLDLLSPPDPGVFPEFDYTLKAAFSKEMELLFKDFIENDRSIVEFLSTDYSFLNERLAKHYGIPGVYGSHFRRVSLPDEHRWGLLGKGSILTVTSYATRTSPTLRGKWILESIMGTPVPPPPPDVPSLREDAQTRNLSMRERMEMHRSNPVCATCHRLMDPLGLAMENYDAVGAWRTVNTDGTPIDASGQLPNGTHFEGPGQLREAIWQDREQFAITFIERLFTYALGRGLEHYDMPAVRMVNNESAQQDYHLSSIVMNVIESQPFQMRRSIAP
jgi:hypothetical protein